MENYWWCAILFRIILPLVITIAVFIRPTITSYIYFILGCYLPFFSIPTITTFRKSTRIYMKILVITCILTTSFVLSFYFALFFPTEVEYDLTPCSKLETALRTVGVIEFIGLEFKDALPWCLPEVLMLSTSVMMYLIFNKLCQDTNVLRAASRMSTSSMPGTLLNRRKLKSMLLSFGKYFAVFLCCVTAILDATLFGAFYYLIFLTVMTYWACNKSLGIVFGRILVFLSLLTFINITIIFWHHFPYFRHPKETSLYGRLLSLTDLRTYKDCIDPRIFANHTLSELYTDAIPVVMYFLFMVSVLVAREVLQAKDGVANLFLACFRRRQKARKSQWVNVLSRIDDIKAQEMAPTKIDKVHTIIEKCMQYLISISYLIANFIMMTWAVLFVSWKTLILIVYANLIWLLPFRKRVILATSPIIVIWVWFLLLTAYLYSLNLTEDELPSQWGIIDFRSGTLLQTHLEWLGLLTQSMFGVIIFITMRQFWQERAQKRQQDLIDAAMGELHSSSSTSTTKRRIGLVRIPQGIISFFAIWWIWLVIITMIWMDFWSTSNIFRIAFVGFAILFLMTFQLCPFRFWKKFLIIYWWIVIIYAMVNLFIVYLYQIPLTREYMHTFISIDEFHRFGFTEWEDPTDVTFSLIHPLIFQIIIVIQLHYLHKDFDRLTSPTPPEELKKQQEKIEASGPKWRKTQEMFLATRDIVFGILDVHLRNVILLIGWYMCVFDMCALFVPLVFMLTASCVLGQSFTKFTIVVSSCFVQALIIVRLLYMNQYHDHESWNVHVQYSRNGKSFNTTLNTAYWLGLRPSAKGSEYADFHQLFWCFLYILVATLKRIVSIRMKNYRLTRNLTKIHKRRVLFNDINFVNCHQNTGAMLKFFASYGFYKFGCEICLIFASFVMALRMDAVAIVLAFWLLFMFSLSRKWMKIFWLPTLLVAAIAVPFQYLVTLGWHPTYWNNTWTNFWTESDMWLRTQQFCHILNMAFPPAKEKISLDFWLLLLLSRQWGVFLVEQKFRNSDFSPGQNDDVSYLIDRTDFNNPVPDFLTYTTSYLDVLKRVFFISWFYLALSMTFIAGTMKPSLHTFGYLVGAFIFAWEGTELFLRPPKIIMRRWNLLIAYTILVMTTRTVSQIFGCILVYESHIPYNCAIYQLFSVGCVDEFHVMENLPNIVTTAACYSPYESLGLMYDCVCFLFLIFQQRIYKSYHFIHIVNDAKAQTILSHRGAMMVAKRLKIKRDALDAEIAQIKANMKTRIAKIRALHQKVQGEVYERRRKNHKHVLKSCDYYIFDEAGLATDIPLLPEKVEEIDDDPVDPFDPQNLSQYFELWHSTNKATVLAERQFRRQQKELIRKRAQQSDRENPDPIKSENVERYFRKLSDHLLFICGLGESFIVSLTGLLNRRTKDFRGILTRMNKERKALKERADFVHGVRVGTNKMWGPSENYDNLLDSLVQSRNRNDETMEYSIYIKLLKAAGTIALAHSEWICYCIIVLNQIVRADFISFPLVILIFCWGALTVPKPTRTFWVVVIAYVLVMLVIKSWFVLNIVPWNVDMSVHEVNIFFPPYIIGITNINNTAFNFSMLVCLFFHRLVLQKLGIWKIFSYRTATLINDGYYRVDRTGTFQPVGQSTDGPHIVEIQSTEVLISDYFPKSIFLGIGKYAENFRLFIQQLVTPSATQIPVDVYTPMFICDLINISLLLFSYGDFSPFIEDRGLIYFLMENRVPASFLVTILLYLFLMLVDRALYLRRNRFGKLVFHFFQVVSIHLHFFILYPMITNRNFPDVPVVQVFYAFKCLYFLFSAYQIRNGYPMLISFHHLWHGTSIFHRFGYKFYRFIPYFFEMRTLLDWIFCDSSLGVKDWFQMEEITQNIFDQRCEQEFEDRWNEPAKKAKNRRKKYIFGGTLYVGLILTVIFPFVLFSLGNTVGITTHPAKIKLALYMGRTPGIYESYASQKSLTPMTDNDYRNFTNTFNNLKSSELIFNDFQHEDVLVVTWSSNSLTKWKVSPGTYQELMEELNGNKSIIFRLDITYTHIGDGGLKQDGVFGQSCSLPPLPNVHRKNLIDMLEANRTLEKTAWLPLIFPKFLRISQDATPSPIALMGEEGNPATYEPYKVQPGQDLMDDDIDIEANPKVLRNLLVSLQIDEFGDRWWIVKEECNNDDDNYFYYLKGMVHNSCDKIVMYTFNEKVFSQVMSYFTQSGILGLYLVYFMLIIGFIRDIRINIGDIWIEDLPNSIDMMRKCLEVYVARDFEHYELEEELFGQMVFIMRSRELLIKLTRYDDSVYNPPLTLVKQEDEIPTSSIKSNASLLEL